MRFHLVSLPHTESTKDYEWCAFTSNVRKFANMMMSLGHEVFLYAGEHNEAACTEHIDCCDFDSLERIPPYESTHPDFERFAARAIKEIRERAEPGDYLCIIGGNTQQPIADAFPDLTTVEFAVGYEGTFAKFRVFCSYAWMHTVYGYQQGANKADGHFYDAVIPHYYEVEDFPVGHGDGGYLLHIGRLIERKGLHIAGEMAKRTGLPLVVAGEGDTSLIPEGAEYVGLVGPAQRAKLMGAATAFVCPTIYVEPFGAVSVEAQLCGTPVISTDWGGFVETVEQGVTGFRCRTLAEFCDATTDAAYLDREHIRQRAIALYSTDVVRHQYQHYFNQLETLRGDGWYT